MSEHIRPEWLQIPYEDVEVELCINGLKKVFSTADSAYWLYPERYLMFNHAIRWLEDDTYECLFGLDQEDYDILHEAGITQVTPPYPNPDVIAQFWAVEMAHYDSEIAQIEGSGDLPNCE